MRRLSWIFGAVITAAVLAACGSSSSGSSGSATATSTQAAGASSNRAQLTACLKQHGVTLPARGTGGAPGNGGAAGGTPPAGATPPAGGTPPSGQAGGYGGGAPGAGFGGAGSAKLRAAFKACGASMPNGPKGAGFSKTAITAYVACVRKHGYDLPAPNLTGKGAVFPASIRSNAKFQKASKACQSLLRPGAPSSASSASST